MSFKLATYATLECLPVGHGNVCVFFPVEITVLRFIECAIIETQSMQCKVSRHRSLLHFRIMTAFFLDYAINNKLTPFISMQNHYNLVYREEEREMFPTLKVRLCRFSF